MPISSQPGSGGIEALQIKLIVARLPARSAFQHQPIRFVRAQHVSQIGAIVRRVVLSEKLRRIFVELGTCIVEPQVSFERGLRSIIDARKRAIRDGDARVLDCFESVQPLRSGKANVVAKAHRGARIYM